MNFSHTKHNDSIRLIATDDQGHPLPPPQWLAQTSGATQMAVAGLLTALDSGEATLTPTGELVIPNAQVVALADHEALALGLPARSAFALNIQHQGVISDPTFKILWNIHQSDGRAVAAPHREGAFVRTGSTWWRLPNSHFQLIDAADRINAAMATGDLDERMRAYARLKDYLPVENGERIVAAPLLRQFQVFDAGAFSLRLRIERGKLAFDPVLYARKPRVVTDVVGENEIDPEALLPEAASEAFVSCLSENTGRYALGNNRFLVLSPHLARAMTTVKRLRDSNDVEAQQRLFMQPSSVLREEFARDLGDEGLDDVLASLFLETKAYLADRVIGIGIWKKPVLPWIQRRGNEWFPPEDDDQPPSRGIRIETPDGPKDLPLRNAEATELRNSLADAIRDGKDVVEHKGQILAATASNLAALDQVISPQKSGLPSDPNTRFALLIEGHYETVSTQKHPKPRQALTTATLPAGLRTGLKEHQLDGLRWLQDAWKDGMPGVLLADDMGLGKTLQALAFLLWLRENMPANPDPNAGGFLIVAPTALLQNWKAEHDKHLAQPGLGELLQIHGAHLRRAKSPDGKGLDVEKLRSATWVLTTYETLKGYQTAFAGVGFRCVVFDEAQKVKSPDTQVTDAAKSLNAEFGIAMTGTPVENRRADLWCISDAVYPGLLGSLKDFSVAYERDESIEAAQRLKNQITEAVKETATPQPFMLRRMKEDILDGLPKKTINPTQSDMPVEQAEAYREVIRTSRGQTEPGAKLKAIHALRMVSLHPWLCGDERAENTFDPSEFVDSSARIQQLLSTLRIIESQQAKALIFVNSRRMQTWLRVFLSESLSLRNVPLINGTTPGSQRQVAVDAFQQAGPGFAVMLLAPKAAGVGLTITAASHVIHLERWWNPAVEDQCTDRAYRIGQDKEVTVWLPQAIHPDPAIREHSFDLRLHGLLENKRRLSRDLLCPVEDTSADTSRLFAETIEGSVEGDD